VLLALEGRAWLEFAALAPTMPLLRTALCGDDQPVLVLPGWLASDRSTRTLRWFLRDRGYRAHGWGLGANLGPSDQVRAGLGMRLSELRRRYGRTVSIVGWSLGGIYAREVARVFPKDVRQVITLATPFRDVSATSVARFRPSQPLPRADVIARLRSPVPVPSTSVYSRTDGVVAWRSCLDDEGPHRENVEVQSSHCGMGHHPGVLLVVADRLAQPEGAWRPYAPTGWSRWPFLEARVAG
jgi:pimeloyl-ACP methyl ester carboxylesterase